MNGSCHENKNKVLQVIYEKGRVSTLELSSLLNVSTETVRRYLESLEKEAKIKRIHGGAIKLNSYNSEENINERYLKNEKEKVKIGKIAATYINNGDKVIIDEGSTTLQIIDNLEGKKNLTIITSSFPVAIAVMSLINRDKLTGELVFLGGTVQSDNKRTVGTNALEMLDNYYVDKAFISCEGITLDYGITAFDPLKSELTKKYIKSSKEVLVLADYSKVGVRNYYKIDEIFKVDRIITNKNVPSDWKEVLDKYNVHWIKAM